MSTTPCLLLDIERALQSVELSPGLTHPAEDLMRQLIETADGRTLAVAMSTCGGPWQAELVSLLSRMAADQVTAIEVVSGALRSPSVHVRSEAIDAALQWGFAGLADVLMVHSRSEPRERLAEYAFRCAQQLGRNGR
jgi:hypothetical protein